MLLPYRQNFKDNTKKQKKKKKKKQKKQTNKKNHNNDSLSIEGNYINKHWMIKIEL